MHTPLTLAQLSRIFQLLETLYNNFDALAKRRRVYKVETIGDCWVGACGLPEVRPDHAVCMARFSRDILHKMKVLVKQLEVDLGPDTGELGVRIGIHSGPVVSSLSMIVWIQCWWERKIFHTLTSPSIFFLDSTSPDCGCVEG